MRYLAPSIVLALASLAGVGCDSPTATDDTGTTGRDGGADASRDTGVLVDAPGTDAPGTDAFVEVDAFTPPDAFVEPDAFVPTDAGMDGCEVTGYPTLALQEVSRSFRGPVALLAVPGSTDFYVVEHGAHIRIMHADGTPGAADFLDLTAVAGGASGGNEQGLLGMALHPDYATNGLFWVYYAPVGGSTNVVAAGHRSDGDPNVADPTVTPILTLTGDRFPNHNGGNLVFGPDGYLYIGTGDGGSGGDPDGHGQDITTLYGKILRIAVGPGIATYDIPPTNPFAGATAGLDEIYTYGMRNPWRFSFDRFNGAMFIGDVGQDRYEEVDVDTDGMGGDNYGWNLCEGLHPFSGTCDATQHAPVFEYTHNAGFFALGGNASITGGVVYRGSAIPGLWGTYLFADEVASRFGGFRYCGGTARDPHVFDELDGSCSNPTSFAEDASGEVYVTCNGNRIYRFVAP